MTFGNDKQRKSLSISFTIKLISKNIFGFDTLLKFSIPPIHPSLFAFLLLQTAKLITELKIFFGYLFIQIFVKSPDKKVDHHKFHHASAV